MDCWRISSRLLAALVLTIGPLACGGARNEVASGGEGGEAPPPATENHINAMPRDRVQDGGTADLAHRLDAGHLQLQPYRRHRSRPQYSKSRVDAADYLCRCAGGDADLES